MIKINNINVMGGGTYDYHISSYLESELRNSNGIENKIDKLITLVSYLIEHCSDKIPFDDLADLLDLSSDYQSLVENDKVLWPKEELEKW